MCDRQGLLREDIFGEGGEEREGVRDESGEEETDLVEKQVEVYLHLEEPTCGGTSYALDRYRIPSL